MLPIKAAAARAAQLLLTIAAILWSLAARDAAAADVPARPNVLVILADDKYESGEPRAQKRRKNRENWPFSAGFEIAGNCGKFRGIPGN